MCTNAATLARELDTAAVRDETGAQVGKVYLGYSTWDLVSMVWPGGSAALNQAWQDTKADFIDSLTGAAGEALVAAAKAAKSFDGAVVRVQKIDKMLTQLVSVRTPENTPPAGAGGRERR